MELVSEHYFLSPEFQKSWTNPVKRDGGQGSYTDWTPVYDKKDTMKAWLHKNSLGPVQNQAKISHNLRHHLFIGENGTLCEICLSDDLLQKDATFLEGGCGVKEGPYVRVMKIRSMPKSKDLPKELIRQIEIGASYKRITGDHSSLKEAGSGFEPQ